MSKITDLIIEQIEQGQNALKQGHNIRREQLLTKGFKPIHFYNYESCESFQIVSREGLIAWINDQDLFHAAFDTYEQLEELKEHNIRMEHDHLVNETAMEHGLHVDDDRDEILSIIIEERSDNE